MPLKRTELKRGKPLPPGKPLDARQVRNDGSVRSHMRRVSKRQQKLIVAAMDERDAYRATHPYCEIGYVLSTSGHSDAARFYHDHCRGRVEGIHERRKRSAGGSLTDPTNLMSACNPCNGWVEDNPTLAESLGLVVLWNESEGDVYVERMPG